jgi:hypothetical protein
MLLLLSTAIIAAFFSCNNTTADMQKEAFVDSVAANIKMYTNVWDEMINKRMLDKFNDSNFTRDVVMHASPADVIDIDSARAYYANYSQPALNWQALGF